MEALVQEYQQFSERFDKGKWTPAREDWLRHEEVGRKLLLATLEQVPGMSNARIEHARKYLDPRKWRHSDFLDRVYPAIACREAMEG